MEIKKVNRNIPESRENSDERFRVRYKDKSKFSLLVVNICRNKTNEIQTFEFESADLPNKDSIHFSTSIEKGQLKVHWEDISRISTTIKTKALSENEEKKEAEEVKIDEIKSFPPIVGDYPKVLILGTMPGKDSLRLKEYYANSRNLFWRIIYNLHNQEPENDYDSKAAFLKQKGISIWDICRTAIRESSLDSDISKENPNDLITFIESNPTIKIIAFNGQKAEKLYNKHFDKIKNKEYLTLLSTSPANASYSFENKLNDWMKIIKPSP